MDIENPIYTEDDIPEAKLVCLEVMGQLVLESVRENEHNDYNNNYNNNNTINVKVSCNECIYKTFINCSACLLSLICCFGFLIFLTGYPFFN
jgi:hypothetical protein